MRCTKVLRKLRETKYTCILFPAIVFVMKCKIINSDWLPYYFSFLSTVIVSLFFFWVISTICPSLKPSFSSHFPLSRISGTVIILSVLVWYLVWILSFLEFIILIFCVFFIGCKGARFDKTWTKPSEYQRICIFLKALKPQWIVNPIVTYHDTLFCKAGLEKEDCRKQNYMKIKTAWGSTISVLEVLVYRATDKRAHA